LKTLDVKLFESFNKIICEKVKNKRIKLSIIKGNLLDIIGLIVNKLTDLNLDWFGEIFLSIEVKYLFNCNF
jgi:hypothetical protein